MVWKLNHLPDHLPAAAATCRNSVKSQLGQTMRVPSVRNLANSKIFKNFSTSQQCPVALYPVRRKLCLATDSPSPPPTTLHCRNPLAPPLRPPICRVSLTTRCRRCQCQTSMPVNETIWPNRFRNGFPGIRAYSLCADIRHALAVLQTRLPAPRSPLPLPLVLPLC